MKFFIFFIPLFSLNLFADSQSDATETIHYHLKNPLEKNETLEISIPAAYHYSNPYLHIFSGTLSARYYQTDAWAMVFDTTAFTHLKRDSYSAMENILKAQGLDTQAIAPQVSAAFGVRWAPLSGILNMFSKSTLLIDLALLSKVGFSHYLNSGLSPHLSLAIESQIGFTRVFGFSFSLLWSFNNPTKSQWESLVGFTLGPTFRL